MEEEEEVMDPMVVFSHEMTKLNDLMKREEKN